MRKSAKNFCSQVISDYSRVHGRVSRAPARWKQVPVVHKQVLEDVVYEKAVGEGIAKVHCLFSGVKALVLRNILIRNFTACVHFIAYGCATVCIALRPAMAGGERMLEI
jgi:hypothetical protein